MAEGYREREERRRELVAWAVACLINAMPGRRRRVTVDQLLGRRRVKSRIELEAQFRKLWERVEEQRRRQVERDGSG